jgi:hypothetical protein
MIPNSKLAQAKTFLELLSNEVGSKFNFSCYNKIDNGALPRIFYDTLDAVAPILQELNDSNYDIYVTVNKTNSKQRKKADIKRIRAVWIDDDLKSDNPRTDFPIPPSMITQTSVGKYHYYWLTDSTEFNEFDTVMKYLVSNFGGDNGARDISRVLRLPGFVNRKGGNCDDCQLIDAAGTRYPWDKVCDSYLVEPKEEEPDGSKRSMNLGHVSLDYESAIKAMSDPGNQHFYEPLRSLALSLANRNMSSHSIQKTLLKMLDDMPEALRTEGWHKYGNEDQIEKFANSAVEIVVAEGQGEAANDLTTEEIQALTMIEIEREQFTFPPGLAGRLTQDFSEMTVHDGMENLCVMMTLGALAGVSGRHITVNNMHTNLYLAYTKTSGAGKSTAARSIEKLYKASNRGNIDNSRLFLGASTATGPKGKMQELEEKPSNICIVDEAGALGTISSGEQGALRGLKLNLFNVAIGQNIGGGAYSNKNDNIPIVKDPAASYLSISTHDSYVKFINDGDAQISGELARTLTHADKTKKGKLKRGATRVEFTDEVVDRFSVLFAAGLVFQDQEEHDFLKFGVEAKHFDEGDLWLELENKLFSAGNIAKSTAYSRAFEIALRISALLTHFNMGVEAKGIIGDDEWKYSVGFVNGIIDDLDDVFEPSITDDLLSIFMIRLLPSIKKLLLRERHGGYRDQQCSYFIENGMFTRAALYRKVRTKKEIRALDSPFGRKGLMKGAGFDMVIEEALAVGLLRELTGHERDLAYMKANSKVKARIFKITDECLVEMKK